MVSVMRRALLLLIIVLFSLQCVGCTFFSETNKGENVTSLKEIADNQKLPNKGAETTNKNSNLSKSYQDPKWGFSINYPSSWTEERDAQKLSGGVIGFLDTQGTKYRKNLVVYCMPADPQVRVEQILVEAQNNIKRMGGNVSYTQPIDVKMGNISGKSFIVTDGRVKNLKSIAIYNNVVYIIDYVDLVENFQASEALGLSIIGTFRAR